VKNEKPSAEQPKSKGGRPRKVPIYREGVPAAAAFATTMHQILNPLPEKKRAR
jgi:hypothetical protein